jgi:hypothetical protein
MAEGLERVAMTEPRKRKRPASGWPKGWEVIGGDVVDYEAALEFDAVILGKAKDDAVDYSTPCKVAKRTHVFEAAWCKTHQQYFAHCSRRDDLERERTEAERHHGSVTLGRPHSSRQSPTAARESPFGQSLAPRRPEHSEVAERCHPETVDPRKDCEEGGA